LATGALSGTALSATAALTGSASFIPTPFLGQWEAPAAAAGDAGFFSGFGLWLTIAIVAGVLLAAIALWLLFRKRDQTPTPAQATEVGDPDATYVDNDDVGGDYVNPLLDDEFEFEIGGSEQSLASEVDEVL
jgi:membrane protein implicated in regulation of membrane protease activity